MYFQKSPGWIGLQQRKRVMKPFPLLLLINRSWLSSGLSNELKQQLRKITVITEDNSFTSWIRNTPLRLLVLDGASLLRRCKTSPEQMFINTDLHLSTNKWRKCNEHGRSGHGKWKGWTTEGQIFQGLKLLIVWMILQRKAIYFKHSF